MIAQLQQIADKFGVKVEVVEVSKNETTGEVRVKVGMRGRSGKSEIYQHTSQVADKDLENDCAA